jgi:Transglycosylase SLT domain
MRSRETDAITFALFMRRQHRVATGLATILDAMTPLFILSSHSSAARQGRRHRQRGDKHAGTGIGYSLAGKIRRSCRRGVVIGQTGAAAAKRTACARRATAFLLLVVLAGCAGGSRYATGWDGRRGYDGSGDYGYDLNASRAEARDYRARAARAYPVPGTPDDPWARHIREAAYRFGVPERWIREVMRQESGGRLYDADGWPITSPAGAMGLMQVMPRTYDILQRRYGLGSDPYEPRDNILAGTAFIREMYERYGAPGFLAAYNAGPDRMDAYLSGATILPDETVNYLASVAPRLGTEVAMSGPLAVYAGGTAASGYRQAYSSEADLAYAGGGMTGQDYYAATQTASTPNDSSDRAFDGGGLVTPEAPTGILTGRAGGTAW